MSFEDNQYKATLVLAGAADLISKTVFKVIGNDASTSINGEKLTKEMIETIAVNRILKALAVK